MTIELIGYKIKNSEKSVFTNGEMKHMSLCYERLSDGDFKVIKSRDISLENNKLIRVDHFGKIYEQYNIHENETKPAPQTTETVAPFSIDRHSFYKFLKISGFNPKVIVDCGAAVGEWAGVAKNVFFNSTILGIDASNWSNNDKINNTDISEYVLLSDSDGKEYDFYRMKGGNCTGDSIFRENTGHYSDSNIIIDKIKSVTLKTILEKNNLEKIDLLKIDTQGSEILIMDGLGDKLKEVEFIELECSLVDYNEGGCTFVDVVNYLKNDFEIFDVVEIHRHHQYYLCQIDVVFQNKNSKIKKLK